MNRPVRSSVTLSLLTLLTVFYVMVRLASGVVELRSWSVGLSLEETRAVVRLVEAGSPAQAAGLAVGDELFRPDGRPFTGFGDYGRLRRQAERTKQLPLLVRKADGRMYPVLIQLAPPVGGWFSLGGFFTFTTALIILSCAGVGLAICWLRWEDATARTGGLFFICLATLFGSAGHILLPPAVTVPAGFLQMLGVTAVGYLCLRFFLEFPRPSRFTTAVRWVRRLYGLLALLLGLVGVVHFTAHTLSFEATRWLQTLWPVKLASTVHLGLLWLGLASPFIGYLEQSRTQTPEQARRLRVFTLGSALGLLPLLLLVLAVSALRLSVEDYPWLYVIPIALFPLFPLSFAYVVVKHRVLGVQQILRSSVRYLFVSRGVIVLECLALYFVERHLVYPLVVWGYTVSGQRPSPAAVGFWIVLTGGVLFGLAVYVNPRLQRVIDRRFFREAYHVQQVLSNLAASVRQAANIEEMLQRVATTVDSALHVKTIGFLLHPGLLNGSPTGGVNGNNAPVLRGFACRFGANASGIVESELSFPTSSPLIARLRRSPEPFDVDPTSNEGIPYGKHPTLRRLDSHLLIPLVSGDNLLGIFSLGPKLSGEPYTGEDKSLLMTVAESVALRLDNAQLLRRLTAEATLRRELEIARDIQQQLLPNASPRLPGLDVVGVSLPARDVGGDYYDFFVLGPRRLAVAIGDVTGHGVSSGLLMALAKGGLCNQVGSDPHPSAVMAAMNRLITASGGKRNLMTLTYLVIDTATQTFEIANAGHPHPYHYHAATGSVEAIEQGAYPLGVRQNVRYPTQHLPYQTGDTLVLYTDGLIEARNAAGEVFGFERLEQLIARFAGGTSAVTLQKAILTELRAFLSEPAAEDDVTLVIVRFVRT